MQDNQKITLVTGFFDCKRELNTRQSRSREDYIRYFEFWARMQNYLVIFGDKDITQRAYEIRKKYGREKQTQTVVIDDPAACDPEIFNAMEKIEHRGEFKKWRERDYDISNEALYNYIMFMKFWMMRYTAIYFPDAEMLAWMDFGFNHGGDCYIEPAEFDYLWRYEFEKDKVHIFTLREPAEELGFLKLMCMTDGIMGCPFLCHCKRTAELYEKIRECILALASLDMMDDDQMWLTMAEKRWPELFETYISDWFMPLKEYGAPHLSVREPGGKNRIMEFLRRRGFFGTLEYLYVKIIHRMNIERYHYWKRLKTIIKNYR